MKTVGLLSTLGLLLVICLSVGSARAAELDTYVSKLGNDNNNCATPQTACFTLQTAHDKTENGGYIFCLDSGWFGVLTISKSITISCNGGQVLSVYIEAPLAVVTLRGLSIYGFYDGHGIDSTGVEFRDGNALHIEHCQISGFGGAAGLASIGVWFKPTGTSKLYVTDSIISENGLAASGGGIFIQPKGAGSARVALNRVTMNQNTHGILADGTGTTGSVVVQIRDSAVAGSLGNGIWAKRAGVVVDGTSSVNNAGYGLLADGPGSLFHLSTSKVVGNGGGLGATGGGQILSYGNNQATGNGFDGAPTGVLALK